MKNKNRTYYTLLLLFAILSSCKNEGEYHSVSDRIAAEEVPYHGTLSSEELLAGRDLIKITEGDHIFLIPERKSQIKSFACIECHSKPLSQMKEPDKTTAHWDITIKHANIETMNCASCHNPQDMNNLRSLTGSKIDFDLSYKLCAQCHNTQFKDWKGGAHGKKISGWTPPRASMTCVECHNPHDPGFSQRWPAQFNTKKAIERKEGLDH